MGNESEQFRRNLTALWFLLGRLSNQALRKLADIPADGLLPELLMPMLAEERLLLEHFWAEPLTRELVRLSVQEEMTGRTKHAEERRH